jgi:hypothetical protein
MKYLTIKGIGDTTSGSIIGSRGPYIYRKKKAPIMEIQAIEREYGRQIYQLSKPKQRGGACRPSAL